MTKIVASVLTLSLAFAAGVVLGARNHQPQVKKISAFSTKQHNKTRGLAQRAASVAPQKKVQLEVSTQIEKPKVKNQIKINKFLNTKRTGYTVLLSSFKMENNAKNYAKKIAKKGYDAFYFSKDIKGKVWHRVGVGSFSSKSTAESLKKQLIENRLGKGSVISKIPRKNTF